MVPLREAAMNLKEHLQFLAMMIPTFVLLVAFTISLAFPREVRLQTAAAPLQESVEEVH
jgi:hypothetical protein